jgi:hypothetical protein
MGNRNRDLLDGNHRYVLGDWTVCERWKLRDVQGVFFVPGAD